MTFKNNSDKSNPVESPRGMKHLKAITGRYKILVIDTKNADIVAETYADHYQADMGLKMTKKCIEAKTGMQLYNSEDTGHRMFRAWIGAEKAEDVKAIIEKEV